MNEKVKRCMDATGKKLLTILQQEARLPFSEIGRRVGLSTPAVTERIRRMEASGIINGYHAGINAEALGYPITAYIRLHTSPDRYRTVLNIVEDAPQILECSHVTGEESFIMRAVLESVGQLEDLIARFNPYGKTATSIVLSTPIRTRVIQCPANGDDD